MSRPPAAPSGGVATVSGTATRKTTPRKGYVTLDMHSQQPCMIQKIRFGSVVLLQLP